VPMHSRVPWEVARRSLSKQLHLFAVEDRLGLFVYCAPPGAVWYFRIVPLPDSQAVSLNFHGMSSPPDSLVSEVTRLVAATLSAAAVQALAQEVMRASLVRPSVADLDFLRVEPPKRLVLTLPHALAVQRSSWWAYFRRAVALECLPIVMEGRDKPFPSAYLWVAPGNMDGVAFLQLGCRGGCNDRAASDTAELNYLDPFPAWLETADSPSLEDDSALDEASDGGADLRLYAVVWTRGSLQVPALMERLLASVSGSRADLALASLSPWVCGKRDWTQGAVDALWSNLERSTALQASLAFRFKGLAMLTASLRPTMQHIVASAVCGGPSFLFCKGINGTFDELRDGGAPCAALEHHRSALVAVGAVAGHEGSIFMALLTREILEVRAHLVPESHVQASKDLW
jgi:hypothetical protein